MFQIHRVNFREDPVMASFRFFSKIGLLLLAVGWLSVHFLPGIRRHQRLPRKRRFRQRCETWPRPLSPYRLFLPFPPGNRFGPIRSGSPETSLFVLKNLGGGSLQWTLASPEGGTALPGGLSGSLDVRAAEIPIRLKYIRAAEKMAGIPGKGARSPWR